jgi:hypothetical protein
VCKEEIMDIVTNGKKPSKDDIDKVFMYYVKYIAWKENKDISDHQVYMFLRDNNPFK